MKQELYFVFTLLGVFGLFVVVYLLATTKHRALKARVDALSNDVWQVEASLRTRNFEARDSGTLRAAGFELLCELTELATACVEHRDVARAWLLIGRIGNITVKIRCDQGRVAIGKFNRKLRQYDARINN